MKKLLILIFAILMCMFSAYSSQDFYNIYTFNYESSTPNDVYVTGGECLDTSCSTIGSGMEFYEYEALTCLKGEGGEFNSCMSNYLIQDNKANPQGVIVKQDIPIDFSYAVYFSASQDSYLAMYDTLSNHQCDSVYSACVNWNELPVNFIKKKNAIAEIGQVNIVNVDDRTKPIQVTVPVTIEETVCSAFRFTDPDMYRPQIPTGYSDYSADTRIDLTISNNDDNTIYTQQSIDIPIEADQCAGLAAFSWTPDASLENERINFYLETEVVDNQVSSSLKDFAEVIETVYPINLDGTCWTRSFDFTLSNTNTQNINPSIAQITQGETLYSIYDVVAYRDEAKTPMDFNVKILFNNTQIFSQNYPATDNLETYYNDISSQITNLQPGSYNVTLITTPVGTGCSIIESVEQTQNLEILAPEKHDVTFHVFDENNNALNQAEINVEIDSYDEYYQNPPVYNVDQTTNTQGESTFENLLSGTYTYTISKDQYQKVAKQVHVVSDMDVYITLSQENSAPVINLPDNLTVYFLDSIDLDLSNYVIDFNDLFEDLEITYSDLGTNLIIDYNSPIMTLSANSVGTRTLRVYVEDPQGEMAQDEMKIFFINNQAPTVNTFKADPDNGQAPFKTNFIIDVQDAENDELTCRLDFGDSTSTTAKCSSLDGIAHIYDLPGTYTANLYPTDEYNTVQATETIFVYERNQDSPIINDFTLTSSNGPIVPTNITLSWDISHSSNNPMECSLRINGVENDVSCIGTQKILNFNKTGTSKFTIIAIDNNSIQELRTLERTFYPSESKLSDLDIELNISESLPKGEVKYNVEISNEIIERRIIDIKPTLACKDFTANLNSEKGGFDNTGLISKNSKENFIYDLKFNTNEFNALIPYNENCEFKLELLDEYGTTTTLSENVIFEREQSSTTPSIRGNSIDILNYMRTVLNGNIKKGYNSIDFNVENTQTESNKLTITTISSELGIEYSLTVNLAPGQKKAVQVPIYIHSDVKSGMYPIRFGVNDNDEKQVRYSYLNVE